MPKLTVSGSVTNEAGVKSVFTGSINVEDPPVVPPVISSVTVTPDPAPAGTERTITVMATDPAGGALTYICRVSGLDVPPVAGQPHVFKYTA